MNDNPKLVTRCAADITPTPPQVAVRGKVIDLICCPWGYEVPLDECRTESDILRWVSHLCVKTWMNSKAVQDFIRAACDANGIKLY